MREHPTDYQEVRTTWKFGLRDSRLERTVEESTGIDRSIGRTKSE
jgi:hypothetical protein